MGLNYAFVFVVDRSALRRLGAAIAPHLVPGSEPCHLSEPPSVSFEDGAYRVANDHPRHFLAFRDPVVEGDSMCVDVDRFEGARFATVWLRATGSSLSHRFVSDRAVTEMMKEIAAVAGVPGVAFDREEDRLSRLPFHPPGPKAFPETGQFLPYWLTDPWQPLAAARKQAWDARRIILGARLPTDSEEAVMALLEDDDAIDADVDGLAAQVLAALSA